MQSDYILNDQIMLDLDQTWGNSALSMQLTFSSYHGRLNDDAIPSLTKSSSSLQPFWPLMPLSSSVLTDTFLVSWSSW